MFWNILIISGIPWALFGLYHLVWQLRGQDKHYTLVAIVQTGPTKEALPTQYLAELLGLSIDNPVNLYQLPLRTAEKKLLDSPLIAQVQLRRVPPSILYIDYTLRVPIALCGNWMNTAFDAEGVLFPYEPFGNRPLPQVFFSTMPQGQWGEKLPLKTVKWAIELLTLEPWKIVSLDLSRAEEPSLGRRQLIVEVEEPVGRCILLVDPDHWQEGLHRAVRLRHHPIWREQKTPFLCDLRLPQLAYLKKESVYRGNEINRDSLDMR